MVRYRGARKPLLNNKSEEDGAPFSMIEGENRRFTGGNSGRGAPQTWEKKHLGKVVKQLYSGGKEVFNKGGQEVGSSIKGGGLGDRRLTTYR